jgi:hypothetical protein
MPFGCRFGYLNFVACALYSWKRTSTIGFCVEEGRIGGFP